MKTNWLKLFLLDSFKLSTLLFNKENPSLGVADYKTLFQNGFTEVTDGSADIFMPGIIDCSLTKLESSLPYGGVIESCATLVSSIQAEHQLGDTSYTDSYWLIKVDHGGSLPTIVIDAKNNTGLQLHKKSLQKLNLEGDFSSKIDIYCYPNTHVNVLSVISPDEMELLLKMNFTDLIVDGKYSYFLVKRSEGTLSNVLHAIKKIIPELRHRAKTFKF